MCKITTALEKQGFTKFKGHNEIIKFIKSTKTDILIYIIELKEEDSYIYTITFILPHRNKSEIRIEYSPVKSDDLLDELDKKLVKMNKILKLL